MLLNMHLRFLAEKKSFKNFTLHHTVQSLVRTIKLKIEEIESIFKPPFDKWWTWIASWSQIDGHKLGMAHAILGVQTVF